MIVGVGDAGRGDDAAGPLVAERLLEAEHQGVINSGPSPELDTWKVREFEPDSVLFVDAVDFGGQPGDVAVFGPTELRSNGFDTHRAPLKLTMEYLEHDLKCKCWLLAVQPKDVSIGARICDEVRGSTAGVADMLQGLLMREN